MCEILGLTPSIKKGRERGKGEGQTSELPLKGNARRGTGGTDNIGRWSMDIMCWQITHIWRRLVNGREKDNTCALQFLEDKESNFALICVYTSRWK